MKQRIKQTIAALSLSLLSLSVQAATEGMDYTVLSHPIPQQQAGKIEVLEFFGYFCVHCYHLDPVLLQHSKTFAKDVSLRTEHVVWMPEMLGLAKVAAAVNLSGLKYQANPVIFKAVYEQKSTWPIPMYSDHGWVNRRVLTVKNCFKPTTVLLPHWLLQNAAIDGNLSN